MIKPVEITYDTLEKGMFVYYKFRDSSGDEPELLFGEIVRKHPARLPYPFEVHRPGFPVEITDLVAIEEIFVVL